MSSAIDKVLLNLLLIVSVDVDDLLLAGSAAIEDDLRMMICCVMGCQKSFLVIQADL